MELQNFEFLFIGALVALQLLLAYKLHDRIKVFNSIFSTLPAVCSKEVPVELMNSGNVLEILQFDPEKDLEFMAENIDTRDYVNITYIKSSSSNPIIGDIVWSLNNYLIKNKGVAIDYHIIKDVVDRNVEVVEEDINNRIPAPLYIGLAATMLGIIFGLFGVSFEGNSSEAINAIEPLINGVKIAMFASVMGLLITTIFSVWIFKNAKSKLEEDKNKFLSNLQSDLMPKMNKSKLPEVEVLSSKLDRFAKTTNGTISRLGDIVRTSSETVAQENQLIQEIQDMNIRKVTSANLSIFKQLEGMMESFENFALYYGELDSSMQSTTTLLRQLEKFVTNTEDINLILNDIKSTVETGNTATEFFNQHIKSFELYSEVVSRAAAETDSKMAKAMDQLNSATTKQMETYTEMIGGYEEKLTRAFDSSVSKFTLAMGAQVERTEEAFSNSRPQFEKLSNLDQLPNIQLQLEKLGSNLVSELNDGNNAIITALKNFEPVVLPMNQDVVQPQTKDEVSKRAIWDILELGVKFTAYLVIISYGIHSLLVYYGI